MSDLRVHSGLIRKLVAEANEHDANWKWSVKSISKKKARIFWGYLEYLECAEPYFIVELEDIDEGEWIRAKDVQNGACVGMECVRYYEIPFLNTPIEKAVKQMVDAIVGYANSRY